MWHTLRDLHEDRVRQITHDVQTARATDAPLPKPHLGRVLQWFRGFNRAERRQTSIHKNRPATTTP